MGKKAITITLYMSELIYDVQNKAFLTGRSRRTEANAAQASNMQASDDEEDLNQVLRSIQTAYTSLLVELSDGMFGSSATAKTGTGSSATNEVMGADSDITLTLNVPSNYVMGLKDTLAACLHDYIVSKAMYEWLLITDKGDAAEYGAMAQDALKRLHQTFYRRARPERHAKN